MDIPPSHRCAGLVALALLLPGAGVALAQPSWPAQAPELITGRYIHDDWRPEHGLPGGSVRALTQTRDGYLVLGMEQGLARFDGIAFTPIALGPAFGTGAAAGTAVRSVLEDAAGDLWVGTQRGLFRRHAGALTRYSRADGLPEDIVGPLHEDHGTLLVGTEGGLARRQGERFIHVPGLSQSVLGIASDYRGDVWVINRHAFLLRDGALTGSPLDPHNPAVEARAIVRDPAGRLYVATFEELLRYDPPALPGQGPPTRRYTRADGLAGGPIAQLLVGPEGRVWVGTGGHGLFLLTEDRFQRLGAREGLADDHVWALGADREGDVFVGTGGGLARLRKRAVLTHSDSLPPVWSVCGDQRTLWLGTHDGLLRLAPEGRTRYTRAQGLPSDAVLSCLVTPGGQLIAGTRAGPARFQGGRFVPLSPGMPTLGILSMLEDRSGDLWLGETDVLFRLRGGALTTYTQREGLPEGPIRVLREDRSGGILIGGKSLVRLRGGVLSGDGTHLGPIMDAAVGMDDHGGEEVWLTTYGRGLHLLRAGRYFHFEAAARELAGTLLRILDDGRGAFWITSEDGLLRVEKQALREVADGTRAGVPVRRFDKGDGLLSTDFNASGQSSGWLGPDGRLWLPNGSGLLELDPSRLPRNPVPPLVHIERVSADGVEQATADPLTLPAGAGSVEIRYTAPSLRRPRQVRFRYRLDGAGAEAGGTGRTEWIDAGARRVATYTGLPSGRYRFVVEAQNEDGVWSTRDAAIALRLPPPLSRRPWFLALCAGGGLGLLLLGSRLVARRHLHRALRLRRMVDQRTADLQREIGERLRAEDALRRSRDDMEERVRGRTAQLSAELLERSRLEQELLQARKLEAVGRLAGGVAHDLNNMLTAIVNYAAFAREGATDERVREDIQGIRDAAARAAHLTGQLLVFARRHVAAPRSFDLNGLVTETAGLLRRVLGENITIELGLAKDLWPIFADPNQIEQVLVNLSINARDAMPGGGRLHIETRNVKAGASGRALPLTAGEYVLTVVTDQGSGMSADVRQHLFEPFFTTKALGRGTGLGLATCHGIVGQGGGHIEVESEVGRGTAVSVYLPRSLTAPETPTRAAETPPPRGSETVLLVEDMDEVREVTARTLRGLGYHVMEARSGEDALQLVAAQVPDVVVTDVVMPGIGGLELAVRLRTLLPGVPVLFISGYLDHALSHQAVLDESVALLRKPYTPAALACRLREVITAPPLSRPVRDT